MELVAGKGIEATSMDAVAARSGVSKATIYKHWKDKDALVLEVLAVVHGHHQRPAFDSGDVRADILAVLTYRPKDDTGLRERIMPHMISYSAIHPEFGLAWRNLVMEPPRRELRRLLRTGIQRGELAPGLDTELALALLLGPLMYWFIFLRRKEEVPLDLAAATVDTFWRAHAIAKPPRKRQ